MAQHVAQQRGQRAVQRELMKGAEAYLLRTPEIELRRHRRELQLQSCTYQMVEQLGAEALVIATGQAVTVNQSIAGMLLMMSHAPEVDRYLEVHTNPVLGRRTAYLMEVRWTKPIRSGAEADLFLVGCQHTFGPCQYFQL